MAIGRAKITLPGMTIRAYGPGVPIDLPEDHPFYARVGLVASEWAHFEHILDLIIWRLAEVDDRRGACITAQIMGAGGRCKAISTLAGNEGLPNTLIKRVRKLMSDSYPVADLRARLVHDPWYKVTGADSPGQFRSMAFSDHRYGVQYISESEIADTLERVRGLKATAASLRHDFESELATLRKKQP